MFFRKKKLTCPRCGFPIEPEWRYCPNCGFFLGGIRSYEKEEEVKISPFFEDFEKIIEKEFERIDRMFKQMFKFPQLDDFFIEKKRPYFKSSGISIVIKSEPGKKPKVYVKTFGDYKNIEPQLKKRFGVKEEKEVEKRSTKIPKYTEEPEARIRKEDGKIVIEVELPDVKDEKDIEIRKLEQSIEIKAFAGDKAYFKLFPIPENSYIIEKKFKNGKLKIVLGY